MFRINESLDSFYKEIFDLAAIYPNKKYSIGEANSLQINSDINFLIAEIDVYIN